MPNFIPIDVSSTVGVPSPAGSGQGYLSTDGTTLMLSTPGKAARSVGNAGRMFEKETLDLAQKYFPDAGFNRCVGTDFTPVWEASLAGTSLPTIDPLYDGGVVQFGAGGTSQVALNPTTPGGTAYNPIIGSQFQTRATPWLIRGRMLINATQFTNGTETVLLSMDDGVSLGGATHMIQLVGMGAVDTSMVQIRLRGGNFFTGPTNVGIGKDGVLGGDGGIPVNQMFNIVLYFDGTKIGWMINDKFDPTNTLDATKGQMLAMPQLVGWVTVNSSASNDTTIGNNFKLDALACAYGATLRNV